MIGSYKLGFIFGSCLLLTLIWCETALGRASQKQQLQKDQEETQEEVKVEDLPPPLPEHTKKIEYHHEKNNPSLEEQSSDSKCFRCCDSGNPMYQPMPMPQINITILKGEKGDRGERGLQGKFGKTGSIGARGHVGPKGQKGTMGAPGDRCKFYCYVPGIYFFSLNVHTWNQKETYLHIMKNDAEVVILYAQVSDRSIMQSQSLMLELQEQDEVWVRLFKGERENAIFSDEFDTYITFSGYLIKHNAEP
ncbi:complement C1q tumor necrosis factor-related protein 1 isoform X4 [Petaurus breviceps papuanus]|uniref:complement C1q tumor necrosis factor-related protein 1 isoform X4 n=1 Tax=Petaurus breviceps papuanus TaxID=3040969 RepID=UPI0036DD94ED